MTVTEMDEMLERIKAALPFGVVLYLDTEEGSYDTVREAVDALETAWEVQVA